MKRSVFRTFALLAGLVAAGGCTSLNPGPQSNEKAIRMAAEQGHAVIHQRHVQTIPVGAVKQTEPTSFLSSNSLKGLPPEVVAAVVNELVSQGVDLAKTKYDTREKLMTTETEITIILPRGVSEAAIRSASEAIASSARLTDAGGLKEAVTGVNETFEDPTAPEQPQLPVDDSGEPGFGFTPLGPGEKSPVRLEDIGKEPTSLGDTGLPLERETRAEPKKRFWLFRLLWPEKEEPVKSEPFALGSWAVLV